MNNLSDFVSFIKKNSIARVNRFRVQFSIPQKVMDVSSFITAQGDMAKTLSLTCMITDLPGQTAQTSSIDYGNYTRKIVWGRTMGDFSTSFLVTGKYLEKKVFDVWMALLQNNENDHSIQFYDEYITNINLECLNEKDEVMYRLEITEAYPLNVSNLKLDRTAQNAQMVLDVSWAYHKCNVVLDNVGTKPPATGKQVPPTEKTGANAGKKRLLPVPGIDQMSDAVRSAAAVGTEFRTQLQGVLNIAKDVREQVRDFKMSAVNGVKILNGVVKDVKAINNIPTDVKKEVLAVVNDTKNQIGYLKNDTKNISKYPTK